MALVSLIEKGFIYEDDFSTGTLNTRWEVTPNIPSRILYDGTQLNLKHGSSNLYLFLKELSDKKEFVFDLKNNYNPTIDNDMGGIIVYSNANDFIALEEYFNVDTGTTESYEWIRLVRDHNNYSAYWSNDGVLWNFIAVNDFDHMAPKIGLFIEGPTGDDLGVEYIRAYKSNKVTIGNLEAGSLVSLVDSLGNEISTQLCRQQDNQVVFDVSDLPMPFNAKVVIKTSSGTLDSNRYFDIYGGDVYNFQVTPEVIFIKNGVEYYLDNNTEEFLGYMSQNTAFEDCKIIVRNPLPGRFRNVHISLMSYNGTDHWQRLIDIANDSTGTLVWGDTVNFLEILGGTEKLLWARLMREYDPTKHTSQVYFALNVNATYDTI